jgi:hypothetical protein
VLTGASGSLLLQPSEFIDSRKEAEAMAGRVGGRVGRRGGHGAAVGRVGCEKPVLQRRERVGGCS